MGKQYFHVGKCLSMEKPKFLLILSSSETPKINTLRKAINLQSANLRYGVPTERNCNFKHYFATLQGRRQ